MQRNGYKLVALSALMTGLAGVIHLWIIPEHWEHSQAHAFFFLLVGVAQIVWGITIWRRPSARLYYIGAGMAGWLIVLYGITRWLPAPFGHGPEEINMTGIVTKLLEGVGMIALMILIFQDLNVRAGRPAARKAIALIILISFIAGFVTYGVGLAAEPIFPGLSAPEEQHHHNNSAPAIMEPIELQIKKGDLSPKFGSTYQWMRSNPLLTLFFNNMNAEGVASQHARNS